MNLYIYFKVYLFILKERELRRGRVREREGERERIPSRLWAVSLTQGLNSENREIMT